MDVVTLGIVIALWGLPWWRLSVTGYIGGYLSRVRGEFGPTAVCWTEEPYTSCRSYASFTDSQVGDLFAVVALVLAVALAMAVLLVIASVAGALRPRYGTWGVFAGVIGSVLAAAAGLYIYFALPTAAGASPHVAPTGELPTIAGLWGSASETTVAATWGAATGWFLAFPAAGLFAVAAVLAWKARASVLAFGDYPVKWLATSRLRVSRTDLVYSRHVRTLRRTASWVLVVAWAVHSVAVVVGLFLFRALIVGAAGREVSWGEILEALERLGLLGVFFLGVFGQVGLGLLALLGGALLYRAAGKGNPVVTLPVAMVIAGAFAVFFSIVLFGGLLGAVGGLLSIAAGVLALAAQLPAFAPAPVSLGPTPPSPPP